MTCYIVQPRDRVFIKGYGFLSFAKNIKNICKSISKNLNGKYSQKLLDHAKQSATDALKTASKRAIQKTDEATSDLIGNKFADKITKMPRISPQNSSETIANEAENIEHEKEIPKRRYISPEERQKIINNLRLI